jgi:diguanylate cyclase (GGDEF)-like protein
MNPEDERPTGRWSTPTEANVPAHVRDRGVLVRIDGESTGEVRSLPRSPSLVGRSSGAQVHVAEPSVSREHARIVYEDGAYHIEDLGSLTGTEVAGQRVTRSRLHDGDLVQIGQRAKFRFQLMDAAQEDVFRRLYESSTRDQLTGVENRRSLDGRLVSEIAFARRHKRPLSVILLDIDFFKHINDHHGHPAGDEVLRTVATTVKNQLRTEDVFARYGGEEFAIILLDVGKAAARDVGERIAAQVAEFPFEFSSTQPSGRLTISVGVASFPDDGAEPAMVLAAADRALFAAKNAGRNTVRVAGQ